MAAIQRLTHRLHPAFDVKVVHIVKESFLFLAELIRNGIFVAMA